MNLLQFNFLRSQSQAVCHQLNHSVFTHRALTLLLKGKFVAKKSAHNYTTYDKMFQIERFSYGFIFISLDTRMSTASLISWFFPLSLYNLSHYLFLTHYLFTPSLLPSAQVWIQQHSFPSILLTSSTMNKFNDVP